MGAAFRVQRLFHANAEFFWGGAAIYSTGVIVRRLYGGGMAPILAMLVLAADFGFLNGAADVRMDMTCASLGLAAVAVYLSLRERDLGRALVFAHALAGLALFTHPNGVFASANLVVLMFLLDRKRLSWGKLAAGTVPYGVLGAAWLLFCLIDRSSFLAQFGANAAARGSGLLKPWLGIWREVNGRFRNHFFPEGLGGKFKAIGLLLYVSSMLVLARAAELRRHTGCRLILLLIGMQFLFLSILATMKAPYYMVFILPYFACAAGIALAHLWRSTVGRRIAVLALACYLSVQAATIYHQVEVTGGYQQEFTPLVSFLKSELRKGDLLCGSAELGFGFGFYNKQLVDDVWLGYWSRKRPTLVVVDRWYYDEVIETAQQRGIPYPGYFEHTLSTDYRLIKQFPGYRVFRRKETGEAVDAGSNLRNQE